MRGGGRSESGDGRAQEASVKRLAADRSGSFGSCEREDFGVRENAGGLLGGVEDAIHGGLVRRKVMTLEPKEDIGFAAHWADLDDLIEAEEMRRHAGIDDIRERLITFAEGFDDGGSVNACSRAESVPADDRVVRRNGRARGLGDLFAIFLEAGEIAVNDAH